MIWKLQRTAKCSLGKILSPIRGFRHFIWKGKTRRIFNIFKMCNFASLSSKKRSKWSKGLHLGSPRSLVGLLLGPLEGLLKAFAPLSGPTGAPCGPPWAPQNQEKVGPRVSLEFHGFPVVFWGARKAPKRPPEGTIKRPKWAPLKHFFAKLEK